MKLLVTYQGGTFFSIEKGYILFFNDCPPCEVSIGAPYNAGASLDVNEVIKDGKHIGFFLYSPLKVTNTGVSLTAFAESKRGKAKTSKLMIRHENIMVYDMPGCGGLAISTKISDELKEILQEQ